MNAKFLIIAGLATILVLAISANQAQAGCNIGQFKDSLLVSAHEWRPTEALYPVSKTAKPLAEQLTPITGILVRYHKIWVETYAAEYKTSRLITQGNRLLLNPVMFLRPTPRGGAHQPANLVAQYASPNVQFSISPYKDDCSVKYFVLTIENIPVDHGSTSERWLFTRTK